MCFVSDNESNQKVSQLAHSFLSLTDYSAVKAMKTVQMSREMGAPKSPELTAAIDLGMNFGRTKTPSNSIIVVDTNLIDAWRNRIDHKCLRIHQSLRIITISLTTAAAGL